MPEDDLILEGNINDMLEAIKSFAISIKLVMDENEVKSAENKQAEADQLIRKLRRQNYYFYRKVRREENKLARLFYRQISQEIAAKIKKIKKNRRDRNKCAPAIGIIIENCSVDRLRRGLTTAAVAAAGREITASAAKAAAGAAGFLGGLLGRREKALASSELLIANDFSKWDKSRPNRPYTKLIILHTTEGHDGSSLNTVKTDGSCNYLVHTDGKVKRIIASEKIANHAGRSMWNNLTGLSRYSIGVEIVGYHYRELTTKQQVAIKQLLTQLKKSYGIEDNFILPHCQVAYGNPNKYNKGKHRPRRKCAMLLGRMKTRNRLGLSSRPGNDPDIAARRLTKSTDKKVNIVFDYLYYNSENPIDNGSDSPEEKAGPKIISKDGNTAWEIAGEEYGSETTIYLFPNGLVRSGKEILEEMRKPASDKSKLNLDINHLPKNTSIFVGYIYGGIVTSDRSVVQIAGKQWNYPSTYYIIPKIGFKSGDGIDPNRIPEKTIVLFED